MRLLRPSPASNRTRSPSRSSSARNRRGNRRAEAGAAGRHRRAARRYPSLPIIITLLASTTLLLALAAAAVKPQARRLAAGAFIISRASAAARRHHPGGSMSSPSSSPPPSPAGAGARTITSPSSLCSTYDELNPALDFFALNAAAAPGTGGDGESGGNSNSPPFVASAGDDRFPASAGSSGGRDRPSGKRPRGGGGNEDGGEAGGGGGGKRPQQQEPPPQPKRRPPTHFVAVRIDREEIRAEVARVQAAVVQRQKRLDAIMVDPDKLHLTLGTVLHCHEEGQVARAVRALEELMATTIRPYLAQANGGAPHAPSLRFPGLGSFGSRVLFVRPCEQHGGTRQLQEVSRLIWECLHKKGLVLDAPPNEDSVDSIKLHGTIAKGSKMGSKARFYQLRKEHWERFERWGLEDHHQLQRFGAVQLLRMRGDPVTGYYEEEAAWRFVLEEAEDEGTGAGAGGGCAAAGAAGGKGVVVKEESQFSAASASTVVGSFYSGGSGVGRRQEHEETMPAAGSGGGKRRREEGKED